MKKGTKKRIKEPLELNDREMWDLLIDLLDSPYWSAVKRMITLRTMAAESGLKSVDPFKEPTLMARYQGVLIGLNELEMLTLEEKEDRKKKVEAETTKVE